MKLFVKNEKGELVEATQEQVLSGDTVLYNAEGEELKFAGKSAAVHVETDPMKELTGVVRDMAASISAIKEKEEDYQRKGRRAGCKNSCL